MAQTTVYDIKVRYLINDQASRGLAQIGNQAEKSARATSGLGGSLKRMAMMGAGFMSFRLAKSLLIDYNANLEQARIQMGGLLQMNMGGDWAKNQERANRLVREFTEDAKKSTATTADFVGFASLVTGPLSRAGASLKDIRDITRGGVIAAKAFGIEGEMAARDIEQAMVGTLGKKDRFARALLEPMGLTTDKWNEMVKKTPSKAAEMLTKAFDQPAIKNMAKAQEKSWAGTMSTLKDNLQRTFGKIGLPLMRKMSAEFQKLNEWFEKNPQKVNEIARSVSEHLVSGFKAIRGIFRFIINHKELLLTLAKAALVMKGAGMAKGMATMLMPGLGVLSNNAAAAGQSLLGFQGGLKGVLSGLGRAASILGMVAVGATAIADWVDRKQERKIKRKTADTFSVEAAQALAGGKGEKEVLRRERAARLAHQRGFTRDEGSIGSSAAGARSAMAGGKFTAAQKMLAHQTLAGFRASGAISGKAGEERLNVKTMMSRYDTGGLFDKATSSEEMRKILGSTQGRFRSSEQRQQARYAIETAEGIERALAYDREMRRAAAATERKVYGDLVAKKMAEGADFFSASLAASQELAKPSTGEGDDEYTKRRKAAKGSKNTTVHVHKIEVVSDDPDRFAFNLVGAFEQQASNPTQSFGSRRD